MGDFANLVWRAWYRLSSRKPQYDTFEVYPSEDLADKQSGRCAKIFFVQQQDAVQKWLHYLPVYDTLFTPYIGAKVAMLEIGVWKGGSLDMWRKFFGPDATLFGIDINPDCARSDGKSGSIRIGSQDDPEFLRGVAKEMGKLDIVLDDGSHIASHQRASFEALFLSSQRAACISSRICTRPTSRTWRAAGSAKAAVSSS